MIDVSQPIYGAHDATSRRALKERREIFKKSKPIGLKRRKSITQIGTEEIVDQIEEYIVHLERTIEEQRVFIKSLLEENRMLKLKLKIRRNIAYPKDCSDVDVPAHFSLAKRDGRVKHRKEVMPSNNHRTKPNGHLIYAKKRNDPTLIERLLDPGSIATKPSSVRVPIYIHSNPTLKTAGNSPIGMSYDASYKAEAIRRHSQRSKQPTVKRRTESRGPADAARLQQWLEENDDDLWSDY